MSLDSQYIFSANMDVEKGKEDLFNEVYDTEHVPLLKQVPGVISIARFKTQELTMTLGGETHTVIVEGEPKYSAIYEIESPEVLSSKEWGIAVEKGRWPEQIRPYTTNRRHILRKRISPTE